MATTNLLVFIATVNPKMPIRLYLFLFFFCRFEFDFEANKKCLNSKPLRLFRSIEYVLRLVWLQNCIEIWKHNVSRPNDSNICYSFAHIERIWATEKKTISAYFRSANHLDLMNKVCTQRNYWVRDKKKRCHVNDEKWFDWIDSNEQFVIWRFYKERKTEKNAIFYWYCYIAIVARKRFFGSGSIELHNIAEYKMCSTLRWANNWNWFGRESIVKKK